MLDRVGVCEGVKQSKPGGAAAVRKAALWKGNGSENRGQKHLLYAPECISSH